MPHKDISYITAWFLSDYKVLAEMLYEPWFKKDVFQPT